MGIAGSYSILAALPLLPLLYLGAGLGLTACTVIANSLLMAGIKQGRPIKLFSPQFLRWWAASRLVDVTNAVFMRHFRGTAILSLYYSLLVST